jgi:hypothetical protein
MSLAVVRYFLVTTAIVLSLSRAALALIVGNVNGSVANTALSPADFPGWTLGDPGWSNFSLNGSSYVYLGDGWVLSARHVGNPGGGVQFQTPSGPQIFQKIPGSYYRDYGYLWTNGEYYHAVSNPPTIQTETGQSVSLTEFTDLQLFRINGDPGLPSLAISSQPVATSDFNRANAPPVVIVGGGNGRSPNQVQWNVTQHSDTNWTWSQTAGSGTHQGYFNDGVPLKRWGTNRLVDIRPNFNEPPDSGATDFSSIFSGVVSDTTGILKLPTGDGVTRDVIASMTVYDQAGGALPPYGDGLTNLETQAIPGDSGSAVFFRRNNQWELAGIVNATFNFTNQPSSTAVFGNATMLSDLSFYNQDYFRSLKHIMESHADYSIMGDVNLDGVISGNGTGSAASDDVSAFIVGWNYSNGTGVGTVTSWKNGDLNRDGTTDVADFLKLRAALNGQVPSAAVAALFGDSAIPEPSAAVLAVLAASLSALRLRCQALRAHR